MFIHMLKANASFTSINGIFLRHFALEMATVDFCPFFRVMVVGRVPPPKADE